jgi:hypothetical protein
MQFKFISSIFGWHIHLLYRREGEIIIFVGEGEVILIIIMLSVNFFCNISSYDILAYITKNYIVLIYYAKIVHLLCQFHAGKVEFSAVCQSINHLYSHKPYTTVQRRHKYTYNKYRIDINIYTLYTTKTWVWDSLENKRFIYISYKFT